MRTITENIYTIKELKNVSAEAFEKAHNEWISDDNYTFYKENRETLEEFAKIFDITVINYNYDSCSGDVRFDHEREYLKGTRALAYIQNNYMQYIVEPKKYGSRASKISKERRCCPLTGYYLDEDILDFIFEYVHNFKSYKDYSLQDVFSECFDRWVKTCNKDIQANDEEEFFIETSEANEWYYYEDGSFYGHYIEEKLA